MPIYMDLHIIPGVKAKDVANAHLMDVMIQKEHNCTCMTYWIDEARGHVFCLVDAPSKETVSELHDKAHGLVPHKIIEVQESLVEAFLGRVSDPEDAQISGGLKLINDPSYRILLVISMPDHVLMMASGNTETIQKIKDATIRIQQIIKQHDGNETEQGGQCSVASFKSAVKAVSCASAIQEYLSGIAINGFRISVNSGEPVTGNAKLFGDTIETAEHMCFIGNEKKVFISSAVKQLIYKDNLSMPDNVYALPPVDEEFLHALFKVLEKNWQESDFNLDIYCQALAMSRSQLYRRTVALTGFSPNSLLKEYRLWKAKYLLRTKQFNISQVSFDSGFTSPSYFTKCFHQKFGVLPASYMEIKH